MAKIEAGKIELIPENFDLHHELAKNLNTFRPQARSKGLDLRLHMDPRVPALVRGDVHRLGQILRNLLSNAIRFTREGWVEMGAEILMQDEKSCSVNFWVQDTGIGIPEYMLPRLFEAYTQGDGTYSMKHGGTGQGPGRKPGKNAGRKDWAGIEQDCQALIEELQRLTAFVQELKD